MKLYLGSHDYKPAGFLTVDIAANHNPDIVADITDLSVIQSETVEEICGSHVLEHVPWPLAYKALSEWARVLRIGGRLRIAVPDMASLSGMIVEGHNVWAAVALIYGVGRVVDPLEAHQFGYTRGMLISLLRSLGFTHFDWWAHDINDASSGWLHGDESARVATSLNVACEKVRAPSVPPERLLARLMENRMRPFDEVLAEEAASRSESLPQTAEEDPLLTQRLHMALIDARRRITYLENELSAARDQARS